MTKMLICPKCGEYQEDTTNTRKIGAAAKKAGLYAGHYAVKFGTKIVASAVGFDGDYTQRAAGLAGSELANAIGLDPNRVSVSDVKYKCSSCNHYWTGLDNPDYFNSVQNKTVSEHHQKDIQFNKTEYVGSIRMTLYAIVGICFSLWIWGARNTRDCTNMFGLSSTSYSWHYYVFWPLIVISIFLAIIGLKCIYDYYTNYKKYQKMTDLEYAKEKMNLGTD